MKQCTSLLAGIILGTTLLLAVGAAQGSLYVFDPVPLTGVSPYSSSTQLYGAAPTNAAIVGEVTNAWGQGVTATSVMYTDGTGLSYPAHVLLSGAGGAFAIKYNSASVSDGRLISRTVVGLPTSGTLYMSMLLKVDYKAISYLTNNLSLGMGLATNALSANSTTVGALPPNGVYFGFCSNTVSGLALMVNVAGTNVALVTNPATNTSYFCVARIEIGAGPGGKDIVRAVANPAAMPVTADAFPVAVTNTVLNGGAFTQLAIGGAYRTGNYRVFFDEVRVASTALEVAPFDADLIGFAGAPTVAAPTNDTFGFTATLTNATADTVLSACYGTTPGTTSITSWTYAKLVAAPPSVNVPASTTLDTFATNTCYTCAALATNAYYAVLQPAPSFLTGEVWLTPGSNAFELGQVRGSVVVHRPTNAEALLTNLVVNYTLSGTATGGVHYATNASPGSVTIPAGQDSAAISVVPLVSPDSSDHTAVVTLAPGPYYAGASNTASVTIFNYDYPANTNVWIASAPGNASVAANWSQGRVPNATDAILLDLYSTNAMTWDAPANGLSDTVASWTQTSNYTDTVTFSINFTNVAGATFTNFTVTGDASLRGGFWTHPAHTNTTTAMKTNYYRLKVTVGGNLTVATNAAITASYKGSYGPMNGSGGAYGGANNYGGSAVYGNPCEPVDVGSSVLATTNIYAGGAIWLDVGGTATINGSIMANGRTMVGTFGGTYSSSGGSIYLKASSLSGAGTISANGSCGTGSTHNDSGSGGRVSILLTSSELTGFPVANITAASGGSAYAKVSGAGTVVVRSPTYTNGILYVVSKSGMYGAYSYRPGTTQLTAIPAGQTWTFDKVVTGTYGILAVPVGTTLVLPNGLESVSSATTEMENGIFLGGGSLVFPGKATHTIGGSWILQPNSNLVLNANLVITNGAAVGTHKLYNTSTATCARCSLQVNGDLTVATNSFILGDDGGFSSTAASAILVNSGYGSHGGQNAQYSTNTAYDSIFNPSWPGTYSGNPNQSYFGGGVVRLVVTGKLTVNGTISSSLRTGTEGGCRQGGAGSLSITAGSLDGVGQIHANGNLNNARGANGASYWGASGGGRVAIRLTGVGATFSDYWKAAVNAKGWYTSAASLQNTNSSSAGTVYLQAGADAEASGTVYIRNDSNSLNNVAFTPIPSRKFGGENDLFDNAAFSVEGCARVKLYETMKARSMVLATGTVLDLNGCTLTLKGMTLNGVRVPAGTYAAASFASGVADSSAGKTGQIIILRGGTAILFR